MKYSFLKHRLLLLLVFLWVFAAKAGTSVGMRGVGEFMLLILVWLIVSISGILYFKSKKEKNDKLEYRLMHYLFMLIFAAFFFTLYGMYLEGEGNFKSFTEKITSTKNLKNKLFLITIGLIVILRLIYIIKKDNKKN